MLVVVAARVAQAAGCDAEFLVADAGVNCAFIARGSTGAIDKLLPGTRPDPWALHARALLASVVPVASAIEGHWGLHG